MLFVIPIYGLRIYIIPAFSTIINHANLNIHCLILYAVIKNIHFFVFVPSDDYCIMLVDYVSSNENCLYFALFIELLSGLGKRRKEANGSIV